jgi:hypothetical protein
MNPTIFEKLKHEFNHRLAMDEKRPGIWQVRAPFFHDDGDAIEIYLTDAPDGRIRVCDYGMTLMRLSYDFEIDTASKETTLQKILAQAGAKEEEGNIAIDCEERFLFPSILQFAQVVSRVSNMSVYRREFARSEFLRQVSEFVFSGLAKHAPESKFRPLSDRPELEVDYRFKGKRPIYLFAVKDAKVARLSVISCLEFLRAGLSFRSVIVHEDFESLGKKDCALVTNIADKQFTCFEEFEKNGPAYIERELDPIAA